MLEISKLKLMRGVLHSYSPEDIRLRVRVFPHLASIYDPDGTLLPLFPPLNKFQVLRGKTEKDVGKDLADRVLVLCNDDFTYGFVVCILNNVCKNRLGDEGTPKYNFDDFSGFLKQRNLWFKEETNIEDFYIQSMYINQEEKGGSHIIGFHTKTGELIAYLDSGTTFILQKGKIEAYVVGMKNGIEESSRLKIEPSKVTIEAPVLDCSGCGEVKLGRRGIYLLGAVSPKPVSTGGVTLTPLPKIKG